MPLAVMPYSSGMSHRTCRSPLHHSKSILAGFRPLHFRLPASSYYDSSIILWDSQSGKLFVSLRGHYARACCIAFSPDGLRLASASAGHSIRLWDATLDKPITLSRRHPLWVKAIPFLLDKMRLTSASGDYCGRQSDADLGLPSTSPKGPSRWVVSISFSGDGLRVASIECPSRSVRLWDATSGKLVALLKGRSYLAQSIAFSPDGLRFAAGFDQSVQLWDAASEKPIASLKGYISSDSLLHFPPTAYNLPSDPIVVLNCGMPNRASFLHYSTLNVKALIAFGPLRFHRTDCGWLQVPAICLYGYGKSRQASSLLKCSKAILVWLYPSCFRRAARGWPQVPMVLPYGFGILRESL